MEDVRLMAEAGRSTCAVIKWKPARLGIASGLFVLGYSSFLFLSSLVFAP